MANTVSKILFSLSETDKEIQQRVVQRTDLKSKCSVLETEVGLIREQLAELGGGGLKEALSRQAIEQHRLREEEAKIVERRKQLTALGGAKSAKLVERELDIASRIMETLERAFEEASEEVERLENEKLDLSEKLSTLSDEFESESEVAQGSLKEIDKDLKKLEKQRNGSYQKIEDRLRNLYKKVNERYPGEAVAVAKAGACRSCFRALPAQTFNQVIAGNLLIQCPGCSRILVYAEAQ